jgi:prepilin peptidase CpaA
MGHTIDFLCTSLLLLWGIPIVYFDIRYNKIPNALTYSGIILGLVALILFRNESFLDYTMAFIAGFGVFYILHMFGWIGGGDVKLMGMVGILMGLHFLVNALVYIAIAGGVLALIKMAILFFQHKPIRGAQVPYGTAIVAGCYFTVFQMLLRS